MHIHVLGVCGTFMAGVAHLARAAGHRVSGSDAHTYPPMSDQLARIGIEVMEGYSAAHLEPAPDCVVVGNALSRGNPAVEAMLDRGLPYASGPQWLADHVLAGRWVLAVAGTHGKTTTSSLLAWLLEAAGERPGFLVGGVPENFGVSARLGEGPAFVVEADEYDTAFFDKRSKFVHYRPRTLVLNNLEFDHADIFDDLAAIERQFHHLVRTVPGSGRILSRHRDPALSRVLEQGCWTPVETFGDAGAGDGEPLIGAGADWSCRLLSDDATRFELRHRDRPVAKAAWEVPGRHNAENALAAVAAAAHAGVDPAAACRTLADFRNVKRRLELRGSAAGISVYDDFAHHPTAIRATLAALRARIGPARILALLEPRSNTMRMGVHVGELAASLADADRVWMLHPPDLAWEPRSALAGLGAAARVCATVDDIIAQVRDEARAGDHVLIMSNGAFGGIHPRLLAALDRGEAR